MRLLEKPRRTRHPTSQTRSHLRDNTGVARVTNATTSKLKSDRAPSMRIEFFSESAMAFNAMHNPQVLARAPISISLNSAALRIAVKDAVATIPEASPGAEVAGTTVPAFVSFTGRWPLLEAKDGAAMRLLPRHPPSHFQSLTLTFRELILNNFYS